jgi:hypothetical protein
VSCDGGLLRRDAFQLSALTINANCLKPHGICRPENDEIFEGALIRRADVRF